MSWTQFKLTVGAPDAEAKFKTAIDEAVKTDANAKVYPVLYVRIDIKPDTPYLFDFFFPRMQAFHGSPLKNWHSVKS